MSGSGHAERPPGAAPEPDPTRPLDDDGANGDKVGTALDPLDPQLAPLGTNGGPTRTSALMAASPAAGAGSAADPKAWPISDEGPRGSARRAASRGASDVGAYDTGG